jgi:outer membrane lipoprotein-sorting protein
MRSLFALLCLILSLPLRAQDNDPILSLLEKIRGKMKTVKDFQAKANIKIDVEFLKAPVQQAMIYYKQPNKVRIKSDGFAMLPKQGAGLPLASVLDAKYTAVQTGQEKIKGNMVKIIKVIPLADTGQIIMSTLWVDDSRMLVLRMNTVTKNGTMVMDMEYSGKYDQYMLPDKVVFNFDLPNFTLPKSLTGDLLGESKKPQASATKASTKGSATITYSSYQINKGVQDSVFE